MVNYSYIPFIRDIDKRYILDICNDDPDDVHKMLTINELTGNPDDILLRCLTNPDQFAYMQNYLQNVSTDFFLSDAFDKGDMYLLVRPRDASKNFAHSDDFANYIGRFYEGIKQYDLEKSNSRNTVPHTDTSNNPKPNIPKNGESGSSDNYDDAL